MAIPFNDATFPSEYATQLILEDHVQFILNYGSKQNEYEHALTEYLRLSGIYWCSTALDIANHLVKTESGNEQSAKAQEAVDFTLECLHSSGGFQPAPGHDPHLLHTLSAIQILWTFDALNTLPDRNVIADFVASLQNDDGSFSGDKWGEVDTRFTFCALATLILLSKGRSDSFLKKVNTDKATDFILSCHNFDGGFGSRPDSESHAGQVYCCVGALKLLDKLHLVDIDRLGWWLCERQLPSGGLNGRPEKLPDVCYSWWVLASLEIIDRLHWIDKEALSKFILASQDVDIGGFSDRPGDLPDPFHTLFGLGGLSLLGWRQLKTVNPIFCMAQELLPDFAL